MGVGQGGSDDGKLDLLLLLLLLLLGGLDLLNLYIGSKVVKQGVKW